MAPIRGIVPLDSHLRDRDGEPSIPASAPTERRQWSRDLSGDEQALVHVTHRATILDESPAGIGLLMSDAANLLINQRVEVRCPHTASAVVGRITNVHRTESGQWRVGVQLDDTCLPAVYTNP